MSSPAALQIFLAAPPGLEPLLRAEAAELGLTDPVAVAGGVETACGWSDVWRANLQLRGAVRVLVRIGEMRVSHLAQLDKRARQLPWARFLRPDQPVRVEATSRKSRLYHTGAIAQRVGTAIREELGAPVLTGAGSDEDDAALRVFVRIDQNLCTVSVDASGAPLHRRGFKQAVGKAPLRETMAALFLRACGYRGEEPVLDPMCGSGTIPIEAAEIALGLAPGRARSFAFERLASFDPTGWATLRETVTASRRSPPEGVRFFGADRDAGAVAAARANAGRAGLAEQIVFSNKPISALDCPDGPPGLVFTNPPYGARIGEAEGLRALYGSFGAVMKERFRGWRVALVTSEPSLARATGLPFDPPGPPVPHGPLRIRLFQTAPLA